MGLCVTLSLTRWCGAKQTNRFGGDLVTPGGFFKQSRTQTIPVPRGKVHTSVIPAGARAGITIKWFARGGDLTYNISFTSSDGAKTVLVKKGTKGPERTVFKVRTPPVFFFFMSAFVLFDSSLFSVLAAGWSLMWFN